MKRPGFWQSVCYGWAGLVYTVKTQRNAKIHVVAGTLVLGLAFYLSLDRLSISILILTIGAIMAAETINTAAEAIVDLLSPEWHERAKVAKDVAAAAVLLLSLMSIPIGLLILGPPLWERICELSGQR